MLYNNVVVQDNHVGDVAGFFSVTERRYLFCEIYLICVVLSCFLMEDWCFA